MAEAYQTITISPFNNSSVSKILGDLPPGMHHTPMTIALWETKSSIFQRLLDPPLDAPPPTKLLSKTPAQSRMSAIYNFSTDAILREQYRDAWNGIRIGKLLQDLDALAGTITIEHCSDDDKNTRPLYIVTASVDKMALKKAISVHNDMKVTGAVIWVGRSSLEIQLDVSQLNSDDTPDSTDSVALTANFIFVARDYKTSKATPVNRLIPETEQEKLLYQVAEERNNMRKRKFREENGVEKEAKRLEALLAQGRIFSDMPALADRDLILLKDTCLENSLICQPQQKNIHGKVFGGFLMYRAYELAFLTAYNFAGMLPSFLEADHVDFLRPVDVGDFLRFKSCVVYTECNSLNMPRIHVEVMAHVTRPELKSSEVSNRFNFTFTVRPEAKATTNSESQRKMREVVPANEEEARRIIERMDASAGSL